MKRTGALVAVAFGGVLLAAMMTFVIVTNDERVTTTPETPRPGGTAAPAHACVDDDVFHDDDIPAQDALLDESQLPGRGWADKPTTSCRWSRSSQDLLSISECAASAGDAEALQEEHTGSARASWVQAGSSVRLDDRVELYPSRRKPDAFQVLLTSPGLSDCFEAAMRQQAAETPSVKIIRLEVSRYDVGLRPEELGVEFVGGVDISMEVESNGQSVPLGVRVVSFQAGGGLGILTVTESAPAGRRPDLDAIDLAATVRVAAGNLLAIF